MKKILAFLFMVISVPMFAQNYPVSSINISLPVCPDPNTANWGSGSSVFVINATAKADASGINKMLIESKILVTIKSGSSKICGAYSGANSPASQFNTLTKVWSGKAAVSLLGQDCILKPGGYTLCVQFFGYRNDPLSEERCKPFSIQGDDQQTYQPPQAISPTHGSTISEADSKKPINFRWIPVVPKPKEEVHYIFRLIEIQKGQSATAAVKGQHPIYEKDVVGLTQLLLPGLSAFPIAKESKYGWYVQSTNKEGNPIGGNNGNSETCTFTSVNNYGINDEGIKKTTNKTNDFLIQKIDSLIPIMAPPCRVYCTTSGWTDNKGCVHSSLVCTSICSTGVSQSWFNGRACNGSVEKIRNDNLDQNDFTTLFTDNIKEINYKGQDSIIFKMIRIYTEIFDQNINGENQSDAERDSIMYLASARIKSLLGKGCKVYVESQNTIKPFNNQVTMEDLKYRLEKLKSKLYSPNMVNDEGIKKADLFPESVTIENWNGTVNNYGSIEKAKKTDHLGTYHFKNLKKGKYRLLVKFPEIIVSSEKRSSDTKFQKLNVNFQIEGVSKGPISFGSKIGKNPLLFESPEFFLLNTENSIIVKVETSTNNYGINDEGIK